jgi:hypothetical protein
MLLRICERIWETPLPSDKYRDALREISEDLKGRWLVGAPKGDAYRLGFNSALWNALSLISDVAEGRGIDLHEIGLEDLDALASPKA